MADVDQGLCNGDYICALTGINKTDLQRLVATGSIPKEGRDKYHKVRAVRAYIEYLRAGDSGPLRQEDISAHLDLSVRKVRDLLQKLGIDYKTTSLDQIRVAYIQDLRATASGHRSADGMDLMAERVLTERVDRQLKELALAEKLGDMVPVDAVLPAWEQLVLSAKEELLSVPDKLKAEIDATHGIDVDISLINDSINTALERLAYDPGDDRQDDQARASEVPAIT